MNNRREQAYIMNVMAIKEYPMLIVEVRNANGTMSQPYVETNLNKLVGKEFHIIADLSD